MLTSIPRDPSRDPKLRGVDRAFLTCQMEGSKSLYDILQYIYTCTT